MTSYQLACGHWTSSPGEVYQIGSFMPCTKCNTLRAEVIGFADFPVTRLPNKLLEG